jgi:hypothetical protein
VGDKNPNPRFFGRSFQALCFTEPTAAAEHTRRGFYAYAALFRDSGYSSGFNRDNFTLYMKVFTKVFDKFSVAPAFSLRANPMLDMYAAEFKGFFPNSGKRGKHGDGISAA